MVSRVAAGKLHQPAMGVAPTLLRPRKILLGAFNSIIKVSVCRPSHVWVAVQWTQSRASPLLVNQVLQFIAFTCMLKIDIIDECLKIPSYFETWIIKGFTIDQM